ncbi:MAG: hypothetical protein ACFE8A_08535 [Candidatus Hodarchaeota archaeon]
MTELRSLYSEIKSFLSIPDDRFDLEEVVNYTFKSESEDIKSKVLGKTFNFITNFAMFKEIKPFMNSVFICIKKTLEIKAENLEDYDELLIKNSLMRFVQEYITYSNLSQKEEILNFLSRSLEKLQLQPLIINLGLLLKPMYSDEDYLSKIKDYEEIEVSYILNDENEIKIKKEIDNWLEIQELSLDSQDTLKLQLKETYDQLVGEYNLSKESESYKKLMKEVEEMLAMRLTVLSLMDSIDESFEPLPINK